MPSVPLPTSKSISPQAIPGDAATFSNTGGDRGKGIYDATRWVVVFKYSSVNIPAGVTVTFTNHPSRAPVVWVVQGAVTINGNVSVNGKPGISGTSSVFPIEPGPGGFRGAASGPVGSGVGLGPGGGFGNALYSSTYGNPQILPLIGGSGGAGVDVRSGAGGGGAILIAAPGTIQITGNITAVSGTTFAYYGSGGAIKLIANQVTGTGTLNSNSDGRLRIEANSLSQTIATTPSTIAVAPAATPTIFQSNTSPTVRIASVDGVASPAEPTAPLVTSADIGIQKNTPVTIVLETRNFATAGAIVAVRVVGKFGGFTSLNATLDAGGTTTLSTWRVNATLVPGFTTLQARATGP